MFAAKGLPFPRLDGEGRQSILVPLLGLPPDGFIVVDVDARDRYNEITVYVHGLSDCDEYFYFWFNGKNLHRVGKVRRWPHLLGNGTILVDDAMGFWEKRDKYVLTEEHKLRLVPQEFYWVGVEATIRKPLAIYSHRDSDRIQANLRPGSKVMILLCDPMENQAKGFRRQYLVKSEHGELGWLRGTIQNMHYSLEGLIWAG